MTPDSTYDGNMKNMVMNTAWAEVWTSVETNTPIANDPRTKGSVVQKSASQLPFGQIPNETPGMTIAKSITRYEMPTNGRSLPSTISIGRVGSESICSYVPLSRSPTSPRLV